MNVSFVELNFRNRLVSVYYRNGAGTTCVTLDEPTLEQQLLDYGSEEMDGTTWIVGEVAGQPGIRAAIRWDEVIHYNFRQK